MCEAGTKLQEATIVKTFKESIESVNNVYNVSCMFFFVIHIIIMVIIPPWAAETHQSLSP